MDHTCKQDEIIACVGNKLLQHTSVLMLYSGCCVNNEVVKFIIQMLEMQKITKENKVLIVWSYFMAEAQLSAKGPLWRARRWIRKQHGKDVNMYAYNKLVIPINIKRTHWAHAVVHVIS